MAGGGRSEFEQVVAQVPRKKLFQFGITSSASIPSSGGQEVTYIYAPNNQVAKVVGFNVNALAMAGAASGYHRMVISYKLDSAKFGGINIDLVENQGQYNETCGFNTFTHFGTKVQKPNDLASACMSMTIDQYTPLMITYLNFLNIATTAQRIYAVAFITEEVGLIES